MVQLAPKQPEKQKMKVLTVAWNALVGAILAYYLYCFRSHLFGNAYYHFVAWRKSGFEENFAFVYMLLGPIYCFIFIAYALHASTFYSRMSPLKFAVLLATIVLPLILIGLQWWKEDGYSAMGHGFVEHICPLILITVLTAILGEGLLSFLSRKLLGRWQPQ